MPVIPDLPKAQELSYTFASDVSKQYITLASGILALSITFTKEIVTRFSSGSVRLLIGSWILYFLSISFGMLALMGLTGNLTPTHGVITNEHVPPIADNVRTPAKLQVISFFAGTLLIVLYGCFGIHALKTPAQQETTPPPGGEKNDTTTIIGAVIIESDKD
jgi:hypothetical protein